MDSEAGEVALMAELLLLARSTGISSLADSSCFHSKWVKAAEHFSPSTTLLPLPNLTARLAETFPVDMA